MKNLVVTLAVAVAIIAATVSYNIFSKGGADSVAVTEANWSEAVEARLASLAEESDIVDDLIFDANGHVLMLATYSYQGNVKSGMDKKEYDYDDKGNLRGVTTYAWNGNDWKKSAASAVK